MSAAARLALLCLSLSCLVGLRGAVASGLYEIPRAAPPRVVDASFFGSHVHRAVAVGAPASDKITAWPTGELGSLRLWDSWTRWADLEPAPGRFDFRRLDAYVALAEANRASLILVLGSAPRWAAARPAEPGPYGPGSASEPMHLEDWDRYVTAVARRYRGRIARYELWNEPYFSDLPGDRGKASSFYTGSVASLVELEGRTRAVLDLEAPAALLLTPGFVGDPERLELYLAAGGGRHVGGVAYHFYADDDRGLIELVARVRKVMSAHGLAALPLLDTESGFAVADTSEPNRAGREAAAVLLARSMVLAAWLGIERFYQYAWDNDRSGMVFPRGGTATPSALAFDAVRRWLLGTTLLGCRSEPQQVVHCMGVRGDENLSIRWRSNGQGDVDLALPASARVVSVEYATRPAFDGTKPGVCAGQIAVGSDPVAVWWRDGAAPC